MQTSSPVSLDVPDNSRAPPRFEHRTSQTIIDLTEDTEEANVMPRTRQDGRPPPRPPHLGRSDASGLQDVVDLTDDIEEPEVMITGARELPRRRHRPLAVPPIRPGGGVHLARLRAESPSLFLPDPPAPPQHMLQRAFERPLNALAALGLGGLGGRRPRAGGNHGDDWGEHAFMEQLYGFAEAGLGDQLRHMPGLDYRTQGFGAPRKPDHVAPKPARENFTRSPKEDDTIVCPSCDQELVHNKQDEEYLAKKGGRTPTRKEREEHPFWVVKDCGHVSWDFFPPKILESG